MSNVSCQACNLLNWDHFSNISFGLWDEDQQSIFRKNKLYPLAKCLSCGHVQVSTKYDNTLFEQLYFHSMQEAVMWHESLVGNDLPYQQMIDFVANNLSSNNTVVDFGCGEGKLLSSAKRIEPSLNLIGIDFNDRVACDDISYLSHNLNQLDSLPTHLWPNGIDLAMASHVLEHVISPVQFLKQIKQHLKHSGKIFIEVPDFSQRHADEAIGMSNLINLQHIHYYTADTITAIAHRAGLSVLNLKRITTGYIPRLQVLLANDNTETTTRLEMATNTAVDTVVHYQAQCIAKRQRLENVIIDSVSSEKNVGIWGIGADFYAMVSHSEVLKNLIERRKITLFDYQLKHKIYLGQTIQCSSDIPTYSGVVYLSPLLAETRIKMNVISELWPNTIDMFAII